MACAWGALSTEGRGKRRLSLFHSPPFHLPFCFLPPQYKLNTDESPSIATEYGIRSIPTVMLFKGGQKVEVVIGAVPKSSLVQTVEKYL